MANLPDRRIGHDYRRIDAVQPVGGSGGRALFEPIHVVQPHLVDEGDFGPVVGTVIIVTDLARVSLIDIVNGALIARSVGIGVSVAIRRCLDVVVGRAVFCGCREKWWCNCL